MDEASNELGLIMIIMLTFKALFLVWGWFETTEGPNQYLYIGLSAGAVESSNEMKLTLTSILQLNENTIECYPTSLWNIPLAAGNVTETQGKDFA